MRSILCMMAVVVLVWAAPASADVDEVALEVDAWRLRELSAGDWTWLGNIGETAVFARRVTPRQVWLRVEYRNAALDVRSEQRLIDVRCQGTMFRERRVLFYAQPNLAGSSASPQRRLPSEWVEAPPVSDFHLAVLFACDRTAPSAAAPSTDGATGS